MREKIVEIIVYLMNELRNNIPLQEIDLSVLAKKGYTLTEISTALSWLADRLNGSESTSTEVGKSSPHSHRVLHEAERSVLTAEAYGYLLQLREIGFVTDADIESVIDRLMLAGYTTATVEEVKSIIAALLMEADSTTLPGSRTILHNTDTIH